MSESDNLNSHDSPDEVIRVLFCCNPAFYQHLAVALASMLESNRQAQFEIHLITSGRDRILETKLRRTVKRYRNVALTIHEFPIEDYAHFFVDNHVTAETYLRIFAAEVLPARIDKVLYLDCDIVVVGDLRDLWSTDVCAYAVAGVRDPYAAFRRASLGIPCDHPYVNCGVLLMNLARWRAERLSRRLARYIELQASNLMFHDQDAINAVLHEKILPLDYRWNVQAQMFRPKRYPIAEYNNAIDQACRQPAIIHYTSAEKPWLFRAIVSKKRVYFHYLAKTEWRGTKPQGMAWYNLPEFYLDGLLDRVGIDYTFLVRALRRCRKLRPAAAPSHIRSAVPEKPGNFPVSPGHAAVD
jgi:lipopolysaccharide biosynthesis glycosyltransferase